ncbi:polysaccharide biosynthesis tyrosine autokinase [Labrys sp. LIt4]|uniref:GumC family protein n=1 Tax=Labrys sp. LIt4 TaxID=2821355 RepID=UPI001ADFB6A2|nr:polysaccharide biosynthesis tyrosine autokinase [Labrys sp. LIt4]MBP0581188.1 polysaccharide biosynthesis tyrosine autokinase [Labrys sp. LIt4]
MLNRLDTRLRGLDDGEAQGGGFDIRDTVNFVWRQWAFILAWTILAALLGAIYIARQTPLYTATTQLLLDPRKEKAAGPDSIYTDTALDLSVVESEIAVMRSTVLLKRVVLKEALLNGSGEAARSSRDSAGSPPSPSPAPAGDADDAMSPAMVAAVEDLKNAVAISRAGQAYVINVSYTSDSPAKAMQLANAIADAYVVDKLDARFEAAKRASNWLNDRLVELRQQLRLSEEAVTKFRADNNLAQAVPGATLNQEQLTQLNGRLVAARADTAERKSHLDLLNKIQAERGKLDALPEAASSGVLADLRRQENDLSRQEADLLARYTGAHPQVVNVRAQLSDVRRSIANTLRQIASDVRNNYNLALARQEAAEQALKEASGQSDLDASKTISLRELERTAAVNKSLFEDFLQRARLTQEQSTFEARDARIITPAVAPGVPSSPKRTQIILTSLILGLIVGIGAAYLKEALNAGFTTPREIETLLEMPLLASISRFSPRTKDENGRLLSLPEYPLRMPLARSSEAIRSLRSAVQMSDVDSPPKVVQVTSTLPGEGKTTIALMMATSAAQSGQNVLFIDCDLRHPSASAQLRTERGPGLIECLLGEIELEQALFYSEKFRIWALCAGGESKNQPDLLASERMKALMAKVRSRFDVVIVDTPPMGPVIDPVIVSNLVDKVIYIVRWAATAREMVQQSLRQIAGQKKVAGIVFNHIMDDKAKKYGRFAYGYYYGSRYYRKYYEK